MDRESQALARRELREVIRRQRLSLEKNSRLYRELNSRIQKQIHGRAGAHSTPHSRPIHSDFGSTPTSGVVKRMTSYIAKLTPIYGGRGRRSRLKDHDSDSSQGREEYDEVVNRLDDDVLMRTPAQPGIFGTTAGADNL